MEPPCEQVVKKNTRTVKEIAEITLLFIVSPFLVLPSRPLAEQAGYNAGSTLASALIVARMMRCESTFRTFIHSPALPSCIALPTAVIRNPGLSIRMTTL
jgi:hypothetical protein